MGSRVEEHQKQKPVYEEEEVYMQRAAAPQANDHKFEWDYEPAFGLAIIHVLALYGGYLFFTAAKLPTVILMFFLGFLSILGVTAGAHRYFSHRSFKANIPLQILLSLFFTLSSQRSIVTWVGHHQLHHQYADTDADPHNATRGFFFSTWGWLLVKPHPEVINKEKFIDVSYLLQSPIVRFFHNYIVIILPVVAYVIPSYLPTLWPPTGESLHVAIFVNIFRMAVVLFITGLINSVAHIWGYKPIDKTRPGTHFTIVSALALGEGFHNFHHVFPYDYRTSELGDMRFNVTAQFIDLMAKIGWAYDLKVVTEENAMSRASAKGGGNDFYQMYEPLHD